MFALSRSGQLLVTTKLMPGILRKSGKRFDYMADKPCTIIGVIYLAKNYSERNDVSIYSLLKEVGYFDIHDEVSEDLIRKALFLHPNCVNDWIRFSEDKRSSAGWYFRQNGIDYEVGYFSLNKNNVGPTKYSDSTEACAAFIKHEIESIRSNNRK
jgi:hypothetical protein